MLAIKITDSSAYISEADYLAGEQRTKIRHEYVDGKVYAMAGTSLRHNDIAMNIAFALRLAARGTPCRVNVSDVTVRADKSKAYYYPDVMLGCERDESSKHYLEKPCVIVEVTSPSTEWKDHHQKVVAYQKIDSLQAYLIVAQDRIQVTAYYRDADGAWDVALYDQAAQTIPMPCATEVLNVADIYEGINDLTQPTLSDAEIPSEDDTFTL